MRGTVLFVDDEANVLEALADSLKDEVGIRVLTAGDAVSALELLSKRSIDVVVADQDLPEVGGATLLAKARERHPDTVRMMLAESTDAETTRDAVNRCELRRILPKPWNDRELKHALHEALQQRELEAEVALLKSASAAAEKQIERARRIALRMQKPKPLGEILVELGQLSRAQYQKIVRDRRAQLSLAQILREEQALTEDALATYLEVKRKSPGRSDRSILVDGGLAAEEPFLKALSLKHEIPYVDPEVGLVDLGLLARTSLPFLLRNRVLPLRISDGALTAILADPLDVPLRAELERIFGVPLRVCCAPSERIKSALETIERLRNNPSAKQTTSLQYREIHQVGETDETGEGAVQIVDYFLLKAIELAASDLHVEPMENKVRVRVRVDGVLRNLTELPADFAARVVSRVKVLAGQDIAERRLHQDGRIFVKVEGREIDIRVSTYASMYGETIVMRLLDRRRGLVPVEQLGFQPKVLALLREVVLRTSSGLVLVTGPTGSGKTTTLYSFIDFVNDDTLKVISCEDPVEYVLEGVAQCNVNEKAGPTFADSLRAIVRQDPDIIVVGEVRDPVTAALAVEAALTGHKVFSTFHTEDAVGAVVRLLDMGVEPFLVSSTLSAVVAQRLVRRVCAECRQVAEPAREDLRFLGLERSDLAGIEIVEGGGCSRCDGSGYRGRLGVHEVLQPDDDFRDAIVRRASSKELRQLARRIPSFLTLQEDAVLKVMEGQTSLREVVANVPRDPDARRPSVLREIAWMARGR